MSEYSDRTAAQLRQAERDYLDPDKSFRRDENLGKWDAEAREIGYNIEDAFREMLEGMIEGAGLECVLAELVAIAEKEEADERGRYSEVANIRDEVRARAHLSALFRVAHDVAETAGL